MTALAPGKIVLSGAYAVLEGAPAIVTAVDRYVVADATRPAPLLTPEVKAALNGREAPWFDANALRAGDKKLGLGSSAAILVASLGALAEKERGALTEEELRAMVLEPALLAHRTAQGGGSGVDVAASVHGGTIVAARREGSLGVRSVTLPAGLYVDVLFAGVPASTSELVGRVRAFKSRAPHAYRGVIENLTGAAEDAERAVDEGIVPDLLRALRQQQRFLQDLGEHAGARIVTPEVARLGELAEDEGAVILPAGAGGGDVAIYAGAGAPSPSLLSAFDAERHVRLGLTLGARGLHLS